VAFTPKKTILIHPGEAARGAASLGEIFHHPELGGNVLRKRVAAEKKCQGRTARIARRRISAAYDRFYKGDIATEFGAPGPANRAGCSRWGSGQLEVKIEEPVPYELTRHPRSYKLTTWGTGPVPCPAGAQTSIEKLST